MHECFVLLERPPDLDEVERHLRLCLELAREVEGAAEVVRQGALLSLNVGGWRLALRRAEGPRVREESARLAARARGLTEERRAALAGCASRLEISAPDGPGPGLQAPARALLMALGALEGAHVYDPRQEAVLPFGPRPGPRLRPREHTASEGADVRRLAPGEPLADAIEAARPRAVLLLGPGQWTLERPVVVSRPLLLAGEGVDRTRLRAPVRDAALTLAGEGPLRLRGLRLDLVGARSHGVAARLGLLELEDCLVDARAASGGTGVLLAPGARGGVLRRVAVLGGEVGLHVLGDARPAVEACLLQGADVGVRIAHEARGAVRGCAVHGRRRAVEITGRARPVLTDNRLEGLEGVGLRWSDHAGGLARGNEVQGAGEAGLAVDGGARPRLERNEVREVDGLGILYSRGSGGVCRDNVVERTRRSGIGVLDGASPHLLRNRVSAAEEAGILVSGSSHALLRGNEVAGAALHGIAVQDEACPTLEGNLVRGCGHNGLLWSTVVPLGRVRGNTFQDNGEGGVEVYEDGAPLVEGNRLVRNGKGGIVVGDRARPLLRANVFLDNGDADLVILDQAAPDLQEPATALHVRRQDAAAAEGARARKRREANPERPTTRWRLAQEKAAATRDRAAKKKTATRPATQRLAKSDLTAGSQGQARPKKAKKTRTPAARASKEARAGATKKAASEAKAKAKKAAGSRAKAGKKRRPRG